MDLKEKYRLVVATPTAVNTVWSPENDDAHLRSIVNLVYEQIGTRNIKAFWFAGHSHGGGIASRLLMTPFYRDKVTGWVSLSGGRLGSKRAYVPKDPKAVYLLQSSPGTSPATPGGAESVAPPGVGFVDADVLPDHKSLIFTVPGSTLRCSCTLSAATAMWSRT